MSDEARGRIFQHGLHEEGVFYNRLNFFLVFESLLFAATMTVLGDDKPVNQHLVTLMVVMGIVVSLLWWYAQLNKLVLLKTLEDRAKKACPEFEETVRLADARRWPIWRFLGIASANTVLGWFFPIFFVVSWLVILWIRS